MPNITVTKQCHDLIQANARLPFKDTATRLPSGNFSIPLNQNTYERILEQKFNGESLSDALIRILSTQNGKN